MYYKVRIVIGWTPIIVVSTESDYKKIKEDLDNKDKQFLYVKDRRDGIEYYLKKDGFDYVSLQWYTFLEEEKKFTFKEIEW